MHLFTLVQLSSRILMKQLHTINNHKKGKNLQKTAYLTLCLEPHLKSPQLCLDTSRGLLATTWEMEKNEPSVTSQGAEPNGV